MSNLKDFQTAAVDRILKMLQSNSSGRFLLADEVGLGKTLIARGVVERLSKAKRKFTVVYLCSNLEIATQNAEKLAPDDSAAKPLKDRLTLMTVPKPKRGQQDLDSQSLVHRSGLRIFSFTPGTSLNLGRSTGVKRERRLLLYLVSQGLDKTLTAKWREFFRCTASLQDWEGKTNLPALKEEFFNLRPKFLRKWTSLVKKLRTKLHVDKKDKQEFKLASELNNCVDEYASFPNTKWVARNRNTVISEMRKCLAVASLDYLDPDLVVMDEFQRFKKVLENSRESDSVESKLLSDPEAKVLILSATPYKMYTMSHERDDHHKDFLDTYAFLNGCEIGDAKVETLKTNLKQFRAELEAINPNSTVDQSLLLQKREIESDLHQVMCRTERNRYIDDARKGITEIPADGEDTKGVVPVSNELKQYIELRKFLLRDEKRAREYGRKIMDYWKSGPSLLSFMDGHYSLIQKLRENDERIPRHLLLDANSELKKSPEANLKFRQLFEKLFETSDVAADGKPASDAWPFLWIKPNFTYYKDTFYQGREPKKLLVFSHWHFVPKTVAFLTSSEMERRLGFKKEDYKSSPLALKKGMMSIFNVAMPSLALSSQIDLLQQSAASDSELDRKSMERQVRQKLMKMLDACGVAYSRKGTASKTWQIIARLEGQYCERFGSEFVDQVYAAVTDRSISPAGEDESANFWFDEYQEIYGQWFDDSRAEDEMPSLSVNEKTLRRIVDIALYSPANTVLRSLLRMSKDLMSENRETGETENLADLLLYVARIGFRQVRNYFNRPLVQSIVKRAGKGNRYVDRVLDYCGRAHLQAVMDEFVFLQSANVNGDKKKSKTQRLVEHVGVVFSMHSGSPRINHRVNGKLETGGTMVGSAHFALAFGEDTHVEADDQPDRTSRKSDVRNAFNSPFWPFVLATTSVGQEGLDFHFYCKDIVHWNLPSNPVDLEQREGRLNRYNSLAIREMITRDYDLRDLSGFKALASTNTDSQACDQSHLGVPWQWVFEEIASQPLNGQVFKQGLYPHWIYVPRDGNFEMIRRHLMFYSNSRDIGKYKRLKQDLAIYRLVFGQPRQEDIVRKIRERLGDEVDDKILNQFLPIYMINLSPFDSDTIWATAKKKSTQLLSQRNFRDQFVSLVEKTVSDNRSALSTALVQVEQLMRRVSSHDPNVPPDELTIQCAAALYYLVNPYDETYDFYQGIGFEDDIKIIKEIHKQFVTQPVVMSRAKN